MVVVVVVVGQHILFFVVVSRVSFLFFIVIGRVFLLHSDFIGGSPVFFRRGQNLEARIRS